MHPRRRPKALHADPELRFTHQLAEHLHMTVDRMEAEMPNAEFVRWGALLAQRAAEQELERKLAEARR
jgi:hypothetical protein